MSLPKTILVATDFSEHADRALEAAVELAAQLGATVHLVHAIAIPAMAGTEIGCGYSASTINELTRSAQASLDSRVTRYRDRATFAPAWLDFGDAREVIERTAELLAADLIIMGTHGRRGARRTLLGSVAESVVRTASRTVMTVRPDGPTARAHRLHGHRSPALELGDDLA